MLDASTSTRIHTHQRDTAPAHDRRLQPSGNRWFAIYSNPQAERRAADNLHQQNYQTYWPLVAVRRRDNAIRSLLHRVEVPLFPRYLFVSLNLRDPWTPILSTLGVRNLLRRPDGTPQPVAKGAIEALQALDALTPRVRDLDQAR